MCPECGQGTLKLRTKRSSGTPFLGCSQYGPLDCRFTATVIPPRTSPRSSPPPRTFSSKTAPSSSSSPPQKLVLELDEDSSQEQDQKVPLIETTTDMDQLALSPDDPRVQDADLPPLPPNLASRRYFYVINAKGNGTLLPLPSRALLAVFRLHSLAIAVKMCHRGANSYSCSDPSCQAKCIISTSNGSPPHYSFNEFSLPSKIGSVSIQRSSFGIIPHSCSGVIEKKVTVFNPNFILALVCSIHYTVAPKCHSIKSSHWCHCDPDCTSLQDTFDAPLNLIFLS